MDNFSFSLKHYVLFPIDLRENGDEESIVSSLKVVLTVLMLCLKTSFQLLFPSPNTSPSMNIYETLEERSLYFNLLDKIL